MESATITRPQPVPATGPAADDRRSTDRWAWIAFGALVLVALVGFVVYPTYPNYDSYYSLLWGRELLGGHLPSYDAYRAPTPHPLAIVVGMVLDPAGHVAERLWIALCVISFVALVVGVYRLAREAFTPLVGLVAGALICTRFDFPFYAARGYLDIAYMALVVWAAVLEGRRRRAGTPVLLLLAVAGLLRPEAWLISGLYFLWVAWPASWADRAKFAALTAIAPLLWAGSDLIVTGDPMYSLTYTSSFAEELGRSKSASTLPSTIWAFLVKLDKFPVLLGGIVGLIAAVVLVPRRMIVPFSLLAVGVGTFFLLGLGGFSVIDRYLLVTSLMVMVFAAVAVAGWTMLERGTWMRRIWAGLALLLVVYGVIFTATRVKLVRLENELIFRGDAHAALHDVLDSPAIRDGLRCGPVIVPNHKLVPDTRWILHLPDGKVIARSDPRTAGRLTRGVQIIPNQRLSLFRHALVEETDDPATVLPLPGFVRRAVSPYYAAYVRC